MGAVVPGCATVGVADVVAAPLLLLPTGGGGGRPGGGVPVLPGPQDSIIVGEPHVNGLRIIRDVRTHGQSSARPVSISYL